MICDVRTPAGEPYFADSRHVLRSALERMRSLGFDVLSAPVLRDIDDVDDLLAVARTIPSSRTAAAATSMRRLSVWPRLQPRDLRRAISTFKASRPAPLPRAERLWM